MLYKITLTIPPIIMDKEDLIELISIVDNRIPGTWVFKVTDEEKAFTSESIDEVTSSDFLPNNITDLSFRKTNIKNGPEFQLQLHRTKYFSKMVMEDKDHDRLILLKNDLEKYFDYHIFIFSRLFHNTRASETFGMISVLILVYLKILWRFAIQLKYPNILVWISLFCITVAFIAFPIIIRRLIPYSVVIWDKRKNPWLFFQRRGIELVGGILATIITSLLFWLIKF